MCLRPSLHRPGPSSRLYIESHINYIFNFIYIMVDYILNFMYVTVNFILFGNESCTQI